jgi:uncharacterized membrane protein
LISIALAAGRYWHGDHMDGNLWWMVLTTAVFWAAIIVLLVWLFRSGGGVSVHRRETSEEILRRRLAEGEISVEEFETRRNALRGGDD